MTRLEQAEQLISEMTRAEKAEIAVWIVQNLGDSFPGIDSSPEVCGGEARIVRTRIPVWVLEKARRSGTGESEILLAFPTLRAEDLANAWAYVRSHQDEIERNIRENEEA